MDNCVCCGKPAKFAKEINDKCGNAIAWLNWCGECEIVSWYLDTENKEDELNYCSKCDCFCGCHPCKHTK